MTRREVILLFTLSLTIVWRVLWNVDRAINPVSEPERVSRADREATAPTRVEAPAPIRSVITGTPRAPLSPFLWVRSAPRPWAPPAPAVPVPEPEPEWLANAPDIRLPGWLFQPPPLPRQPLQVADADEVSFDQGFIDEEPEWSGDEAYVEEPVEDFVQSAPPPLQSEAMLQRYGPILDPFGVATNGWVPRVGYPFWIWSEGLNYIPGYAPHHHHDSWFEFRLRVRR